MEKLEKVRFVISLLERTIANEQEAQKSLEKWPDIDSEQDELLKAAWHDLSHFAADSDIRQRDKGYAESQTDLLRQHVKSIRAKYEFGK